MSTASVAAKPVSIIATCRISFKLGKTPEIIISRNFIVTHQSSYHRNAGQQSRTSHKS
jgi:hypothetical protein